MGFLVLSRREGEAITLSLSDDMPEEELIKQLRKGIRIIMTSISGNHARLGIDAPKGVVILREELLSSQASDPAE